LTGVFDPPPQALSIPWLYLIVLIGAGCLSTMLAVMIAQSVTQRRAIQALRTI
jgi:putative ABC transport system permease protein